MDGLASKGIRRFFVGMQAFEWTKLIHEGVRPWENPFSIWLYFLW